MTAYAHATLPGECAVAPEHCTLIGKHIKAIETSSAPQGSRVAVFSGHMIDAPGRPTPRFPAALEGDVRAAIVDMLTRLEVSCGYASAACGSDILFLESLLERGAQAHVILPFRMADFVHTSVAFAGAHWIRRFHRVLTRATTVRCAVDEAYLGDDGLFEYTNMVTHGMALLHAARLATEVVALAVCDLTSAALVGGTRATLEAWRQAGGAIEIIALDALRERSPMPPAPVPRPRPRPSSFQAVQPHASGLNRTIKSLLYVDLGDPSQRTAMGNSPWAVIEAFGQIATIIDSTVDRPVCRNTRGDSVLLVFDELIAGAECALRLLDGMPHAPLRLGLHAGPVCASTDPITDQVHVLGSPVSLATSLVSLAPPHTVYMSEAFLALFVATIPDGFTYDYVQKATLVESARHTVYRLRRSEPDA